MRESVFKTDCIKLGNKILAPCEAHQLRSAITLQLTSEAFPPHLRNAGVVRASALRNALGQRSPFSQLPGRIRSDRLTEIMTIMLENGMVIPLSTHEVVELNEVARNGSLLRVLDLSLLERWAKGADQAETDTPDDLSEPVLSMAKTAWPTPVPRPGVAAPVLMDGWKPHPDFPSTWAYRGQEVVPLDSVRLDLPPAVPA